MDAMKFTDIFIRRPVLAMVVSLMILVLGLRALVSLPVSQYPQTENAIVTVTTAYYGADARPRAASSPSRSSRRSPRRRASTTCPRQYHRHVSTITATCA